MRAPEQLVAVRVVAAAAGLDALAWPVGSTPLRLAADDVLLIGGAFPGLGDLPGILEDERGFVGWWLTPEELRDEVMPRIEWPLPTSRPALAQGLVAGVPAKLWLADDRALLLCAAAYAHELEERLA